MTIQSNVLTNGAMTTFYISGELVHVKMILLRKFQKSNVENQDTHIHFVQNIA